MIRSLRKQVLPTNKKRTSFMIVLLAVACGLFAAGLVYIAGSRATPSVPVLAAKVEITAGDPLKKEMFEEILVPPAGLPKGTLKPSAPLEGTVAVHGLSPGDILRETHIIRYDSTDIPLLSARLKTIGNDNMRAVEVPVDSISGMLGGMKAGDRVDIISVTVKEDTGGRKEMVSKKIISSAPVIGVRPPEDSPGVLIIGLTEEQVNIFMLARETGKVYASLCPFGYKKTTAGTEVEAAVLEKAGGD